MKVSSKSAKVINPRYEVQTSKGNFQVELYPKKAPKTVKNFVRYVEAGHYANTIFHRVVKDFVIQGGNITPELTKKRTFKPIKNEANNGLKNDKGTLAMARLDDPDTAADEFFINVKDNKTLNHTSTKAGYCVFGKVISGMDVVEKIAKVKINKNEEPVVPVIIQKVVPL